MSEFAPDPHEPAVRTAALRVFVDAACAAPVHEPRVNFDAVKAGVDQRLFRRRTGAALGVAAIAAALLLAFNLPGQANTPPGGESPSGVAPVAVGDHAQQPDQADGSSSPRSQETAAEGIEEVEGPEASPVLASNIQITSTGAAAHPPNLLEAQAVELGVGTYRIVVDERDGGALTVTFDADVGEPRALVVEHGVLSVDVTARGRVVRLEQGVAAWRDVDGTSVAIDVESSGVQSADPEAAAPKVTAASLSRKAEDQLAEGDRDAAVDTLRVLVVKHPRSAEARTGLLDLARLLKAAGETDASRCAYEAYLVRWPVGALSRDVERSLERLGDGPECHGLRPQK